MKKILVTGGSGFIGGQTVSELLKAGYDPCVVDRVIKPWIYDLLPANRIFQGEFTEIPLLDFDAVIHLAAEHNVTYSMTDPLRYYDTNVVKMLDFLEEMNARDIKNIVFASSSSVYGTTEMNGLGFSESDRTTPQNPYASTKVIGELMLEDYAKTKGINYLALRYFNAGGADPDKGQGYFQDPATHLIPILCKAINNGKPVSIYGKDYDTPDGTCVRDYTHVHDIARANILALEHLDANGDNHILNIGGGRGYSVSDVITACSYYLDADPEIIFADKRPGDVPCLVADITKAKDVLGWVPKYDIADMVTHAWNWEIHNAK